MIIFHNITLRFNMHEIFLHVSVLNAFAFITEHTPAKTEEYPSDIT